MELRNLNDEETDEKLEKLMELYRYEILHVKALGEMIGYGNIMDIASVLWAEDLKRNGLPDDGAFYSTLLSEIKDGELKDYAVENRSSKTKLFKELKIWGDDPSDRKD